MHRIAATKRFLICKINIVTLIQCVELGFWEKEKKVWKFMISFIFLWSRFIHNFFSILFEKVLNPIKILVAEKKNSEWSKEVSQSDHRWKNDRSPISWQTFPAGINVIGFG